MDRIDQNIELKDAKTNQELIEVLKTKHKLQIKDEEQALIILSKVGYYRLSGYSSGLYQKDSPQIYLPSVTFETLFELHEFDSKLKSLLFYTIEQIEIELRAKISNYLAIQYSPKCLYCSYLFNEVKKGDGTSVYESIIKAFNKEVYRQKNTSFIKHYQAKYDGYFPIWVAVELFTFGNLSSLYSILKVEDQKEIARHFRTRAGHLKSWILSFLEIRNICAHSGRLYNTPLKQRPFLYKEFEKYQKDKITRVFIVLLALKRFMDHRPDDWNYFTSQLLNLFNQYGNSINLSSLGFPDNWKEVLIDS